MRRDDDLPATGEVQLADGRWLRISHSATRDGGFIVVCSDITLSKMQEANLRQTNSPPRCRARQHVAGVVPVRRAKPARGRQPALLRNLRAAARQIQPGTTFREILELSVACGTSTASPPTQLLEEQAEFMSRHEAARITMS